MLVGILLILSGILLLPGFFTNIEGMRGVVSALKSAQVVIGVIALVVGILNVFSLGGISLVVAGLILAAQALSAIPGIGEGLEKAGGYFAQFSAIIGVIVLILGIVELLGAL